MQTPTPFQLREAFQLLLLRFLAESLSARVYAVKGGVCLRFFHQSPRLSEDLDLDVAEIPVATFRKKIQIVLRNRALLEELQRWGISEVTFTEPKQTETTQRWKIQLVMTGGNSLPTRLECSRRREKLTDATAGVPSPEILRLHQMTPFVCRHYGAVPIARQKIAALASPSRVACRDLFDLYHLLTYSNLATGSLQLPGAVTQAAIEKISSFEKNDFLEQVAPFLPADLAKLYGEKEGFEKLRLQVQTALEKS